MRRVEARNLRQIETFIATKDYRSAQLALEQAVQVHPKNVEARRRLADFFTQAGSPQALTVWRELVELQPDRDDDRIAWAGAALHFGALDAAREALDGVSANGRTLADYHRVAAGLALATGDKNGLAQELAALAQSDPASPRLKFNAAAIAMLSADPAESAAARATLFELARGEPLRIRATLALLRVAAVREGAKDFGPLARQLLPEAKTGGLEALVAHMQSQPKPEPNDAAPLAQWLIEYGMADDAARWLDALKPAVREALPVRRVRADCALALKDWTTLQAELLAGAWGPIPSNALELAFTAQRQHDQGDKPEAAKTWELALDAADKSRPALEGLVRLSREFGWVEKQNRALYRVVSLYPREIETWNKLVQRATLAGETDRVFEYFHKWVRAMPDYTPARRQLVLLGVLLGRIDPEIRRQIDSIDLSADPAVIVARSWLDWRKGNAQAAVEAMENLDTAEMKETRLAMMAATILADAGEIARATLLLQLVKADALLPEEREIWQQTTAKLLKASRLGKAP